MGNVKNGKFWSLDTAGLIKDVPVNIKNIAVTFKEASAGEVELTEVNREGGVGDTFFHAKSLGATSAGVDVMTTVFPINNIVNGLNIKTLTDIDKLIINTK